MSDPSAAERRLTSGTTASCQRSANDPLRGSEQTPARRARVRVAGAAATAAGASGAGARRPVAAATGWRRPGRVAAEPPAAARGGSLERASSRERRWSNASSARSAAGRDVRTSASSSGRRGSAPSRTWSSTARSRSTSRWTGAGSSRSAWLATRARSSSVTAASAGSTPSAARSRWASRSVTSVPRSDPASACASIAIRHPGCVGGRDPFESGRPVPAGPPGRQQRSTSMNTPSDPTHPSVAVVSGGVGAARILRGLQAVVPRRG